MQQAQKLDISIHAPREGGDARDLRLLELVLLISIHAPREGGDLILTCQLCVCRAFQSTPPARGATTMAQWLRSNWNISIHAPREGGDTTAVKEGSKWTISIHAPREGGDAQNIPDDLKDRDFNPRPPRGGRHPWHRPVSGRRQNFNPRPPRGGRP